VQKTHGAYDAYEFHTIYHGLYNYCTLDLSSFYLDILKDRLYTSPPDSVARKSAQTVMHTVLDTMVKLMAPILPFTAEEIWQYMPQQPQRPQSVHLALLPEANTDYENPDLAQKWDVLLSVRGEVTKALETARSNKLIGHALDAFVTISAGDDLYQSMQPYAADLKSILIVSRVELVKAEALEDAFESQEVEGLRIRVEAAPGVKCERCWVHDTTVGNHSEHPTICDRCHQALESIDS
jgi:isoleucyl-tRNA synthetase